MCFYWESLNKQIRILGKGVVLDDFKSDEYFASRPRGSQIGAWVSNQSSKISSKKILKKKEAEFKNKFDGFSVPRPKHWCGIKIKPNEFEFWQQGEFRLHDRELFKLNKNVWVRQLLSP